MLLSMFLDKWKIFRLTEGETSNKAIVLYEEPKNLTEKVTTTIGL
jgi:hypothetical protein